MNFKLLLKEHFFECNIFIYYNDIFSFLTYLTGDKHIAEDLCQNVMEKAWKCCHQIQDTRKSKAWLFKIAKNESNTYYKNSLQKVLLDSNMQGEPEEIIESTQQDILSHLINIENSLLLKEALFSLDKKYLSIILLRYINELSLSEISIILDINYNTTRTQLRRGLKKLHQTYIDLERRKG